MSNLLRKGKIKMEFYGFNYNNDDYNYTTFENSRLQPKYNHLVKV